MSEPPHCRRNAVGVEQIESNLCNAQLTYKENVTMDTCGGFGTKVVTEGAL